MYNFPYKINLQFYIKIELMMLGLTFDATGIDKRLRLVLAFTY